LKTVEKRIVDAMIIPGYEHLRAQYEHLVKTNGLVAARNSRVKIEIED